MKPIIRVEDLGKRYRIGLRKDNYITLRDSLTQAVRAPLRRLRQRRDDQGQILWALRDVGFEVQPG